MELSTAIKILNSITNETRTKINRPRFEEVEVEYNSDGTADEKQLSKVSSKLINMLKDISEEWAYYQRDIKYETTLFKNDNERYEERSSGLEYTSGSHIEYFDKNDYEWCVGRVEYSDRYNGYYIVYNPNIEMEGLKVRVRSKY